jgi:hypothetical protein
MSTGHAAEGREASTPWGACDRDQSGTAVPPVPGCIYTLWSGQVCVDSSHTSTVDAERRGGVVDRVRFGDDDDVEAVLDELPASSRPIPVDAPVTRGTGRVDVAVGVVSGPMLPGNPGMECDA